MQGTVKWFSEEKGYGFLVGGDGLERYFHVRTIEGAALPKNGEAAEFDHAEGRKGPAAAHVTIIRQPDKARDDRIVCPHCQKTIVPRIITDRGKLSRSVCPFCGGTVRDFKEFWKALFAIIVVVLFSLLYLWNR